ncbi:MAG TPA: hypothetical protein DEB31_08285 [Clostridiales bacterium]|nr:hypothetical protein [Clostridiales bacterium]
MGRQKLEARINALKSKLNETDYKAIKAYEGHPGPDWAEMKAQRAAWREEIDAAQRQLDGLANE